MSPLNTTYILEYYYQGTGYSSEEISNFYGFIDEGYDIFLSNGDYPGLGQGEVFGPAGRLREVHARNELPLSAGQPAEPFDILYFTPSLTWIYNLSDRSFTITPELLYTPITNLELRLKTGFLVGSSDSEFGGKQNDYRLEFRVRYYF